ncbi:hypothetical protein GCM10007147_18550 [Nocardiopsis kunsanensis]|uniref:Uncharacterized protein n=1 Tax=Nocardiopsis kunsanensis TaxID=141693 RepID=A0A919CGS7_9ACTN|nr:hypothetical protein [Nocardiopsis kunsanensis]GHD23386.1 hypothetical protein GCM10007147_18550 [Nocardiopsis kunsanensis]
MFGKFFGGPKHDDATDNAWVLSYALADGTEAYQAKCSCGWFSDLYVDELQFVRDLRQHHADTGA